MIVYMDLVVILNFFVDLLLILGTNRLAGYPSGWQREIPAAVLGGIYAGGCMLPGFRFLSGPVWRGVFLVLMVVIAFGWNRSAFQRGAVFLLLTMALGGLATGMGTGGIPILFFSALIMWLLCRFSFRGTVGAQEYIPAELCWQGKTVRLLALRDTGNNLKDPVTGEQVLVAGADVGRELLGLSDHQLQHPIETMCAGVLPGLRLIPYHAVGQPGGMLAAVRLERSKIGNTYGTPLVAFAPEEVGRGAVYRMLTGGVI